MICSLDPVKPDVAPDSLLISPLKNCSYSMASYPIVYCLGYNKHGVFSFLSPGLGTGDTEVNKVLERQEQLREKIPDQHLL